MLALVTQDGSGGDGDSDDFDPVGDADDEGEEEEELLHQQHSAATAEIPRERLESVNLDSDGGNNGDGSGQRSRRRRRGLLNVTLGSAHADAENLKPSQMVRTREFWTLWFTFFLNTQVTSKSPCQSIHAARPKSLYVLRRRSPTSTPCTRRTARSSSATTTS